MSAATRLRRLDEGARITVVERSGYVSFANCGLPYHVGGVISQRDDLLLQTPSSLAARFGIEVLVRHEVTGIDRSGHTVTVRDLASGEERSLHYDAVVLSPGATPVRPPIPGAERALSLRDVEDMDAIVAAADAASTATVIGGGFIGVELAENLTHAGLAVTLVEATPQVMAPLDPEMVAPVHERLRQKGVALHLASTVTAIGSEDVTIETRSGTEQIGADLVILAIGVRPEAGLAEQAGLEIGERGGIVVDEAMRTSDPAIYAVGDAVQKADAVSGDQTLVPLAGLANWQGRHVADVILGREVAKRPVLGTAIVGVFGLQVAATGWSEKRLRADGREYRAIHTHPVSHAGYYPGAQPMALKLLVDPETDAILGAQGVGEEGVDKRVDVIATAMTGGLTASELADLELSYAPQFGSAKDPVNLLGYVAANLADGDVETIQWHEVDEARRAGATVLDVRSADEHAADAIDGSINIPVDELRRRIAEVPDGPLVVHCAVGLRGYLATRILAHHGRSARNLDGGLKTYRAGTSA